MEKQIQNSEHIPKEKVFEELYEDVLQKNRETLTAGARSVDYSFLRQGRKPAFYRSPMLKVAAILLVFFTSVSGGVIWINSNTAEATRFEAEKKIYQIREGLFSGSEDMDIIVGEEITRLFRSMDQIDKAKEFMPNLCIPEYIPPGYALESLTVQKFSASEYDAMYKFTDKSGGKMRIYMCDTGDQEGALATGSDGKIVELEDRTLLLWEDPLTGEVGTDVFLNNYRIGVTGNLSQEQKQEVAEGLWI